MATNLFWKQKNGEYIRFKNRKNKKRGSPTCKFNEVLKMDNNKIVFTTNYISCQRCFQLVKNAINYPDVENPHIIMGSFQENYLGEVEEFLRENLLLPLCHTVRLTTLHNDGTIILYIIRDENISSII